MVALRVWACFAVFFQALVQALPRRVVKLPRQCLFLLFQSLLLEMAELLGQVEGRAFLQELREWPWARQAPPVGARRLLLRA